MRSDSAASAVCRVWKPEWAGAVMVSLAYTPGAETEPDAYRISLSEKRLIRISAENASGDCLVMTMLPAKKTETKKENPACLPAGLLPWRTFSAADIAGAADRIGDHNPIHKGERPVAGGFLLLSEIVSRFPGLGSCTLRFHGKIFAGEEIFLRETATEAGTKLEAYTNAGPAFTAEVIANSDIV